MSLLGAVATVVAGPTISERAVVYAIGSLSIVLGAIEAASLSEARNGHERRLGAVASVAALVFGDAMLGSGGRGLHLIVNLLGIYFLVVGSLRLARAVAAHRPAPAGDTRLAYAGAPGGPPRTMAAGGLGA